LNPDTNPNPAPNEPVPVPTTPTVHPSLNDEPTLQHTPKKSRKGLFIGLIVAAVVLIGAAVAAFLYISNVKEQANDAASSYIKAVETHVAKILDESMTDRIVSYKERPALNDVAQGETFSEEYKKAIEVKDTYNKLLDDTYQTVLERYSTAELKTLFQAITLAFSSNANVNAGKVTDDASLQASKQAAINMEARAMSFSKLATQYKSYTYAEKYRDYQKNAVKAIESMAESWSELGKQTTSLNELYEKLFAAEKSGDQAAITKLATESAGLSFEILTKTVQINQSYKADGATLNSNNAKMVGEMSADGYGVAVAAKSAEVKNQLEDFEKSLKK